MKGKIILLAFAVLALATAPVAFADPMQQAASHVYVNVDPNIAVNPLLVSIGLGSVQTGPFTGAVTFRVDANTEGVKFMAGTSALYKGDNPRDTTVTPIRISMTPGVGMFAQMGNPTGGHSHVAAYLGSSGVNSYIDGFPMTQTEWVTFESSQSGHFSQSFTLIPTWDQTDPEKPQGEYSGVVSLWAMIVL